MDYFNQKLQIKNLEFPRFVCGPVDGVTDSQFRQLVREFSKEELLYTEIRHVRSIITPKGGAMALAFQQLERPLNFQVSTNSPDFIEQACEKILRSGVDMIDLNVGCPARNVVASGCGSALMANPVMLEKILKEFKRVLPENIPFTIKIRSGFKSVNALDIAKMAQDCGVDALAIHPRLQTQGFDGMPDLKLAMDVKKALQIPVLLSGNIVNFSTAKMAYEQTGVDGFLIGRGLWAKPWKLEEIKQHSIGNEYLVDSKMLLRVALRQVDLMVNDCGLNGLLRFRKYLPFYIKGNNDAKALRSRLFLCDRIEDVKEGLIEFLG